MQFVYPSFLWASLFVAVPIIIHLFHFQRAKKEYFTNVAFLREVKSVAQTRNQLKHLLALLFRCLFIIALALAFAQPYLPQNNGQAQTNSNHVSLYIDNSLSMQAEDGNKHLLEEALLYGEQIVKGFPKSTQFQVLSNAFEGSMNFFTEPQKAAEQLAKLDYNPSFRTLKQVHQRQQNALQTGGSPQKNRIFWLSDFQKHAIGDLKMVSLDSTQTYYIVPLQSSTAANLYVDSVWLENPFIKVAENNALFVKINHSGTEKVQERSVKLFLNGKQVSNGTVSLEANGTTTLKMNFAVQSPEITHGRIELEDSPLIFDNQYYFSLPVAQNINIVHIHQDDLPAVPNVYANEAFFKVQSFHINAVDYNTFNTAQLVVLQSLAEIDNALLPNLQKFLAKGGSIAVFPPTKPFNTDSYTQLLGVPIQGGLGEKLELAPLDIQNPFFAGVFERFSNQMNMPMVQPVMEVGGVGQVLLKQKNNRPFLRWLNRGNSNLFVFTAPIATEFSDFAKHALFVPVLYKIALNSTSQTERLAYSFQENLAEITLPTAPDGSSPNYKNEIFKLIDLQTQTEVIPSQRLIDGKLLIDIPHHHHQAGNYQVVRKSNNAVIGAVAFNYDKKESILDNYTTEELKAVWGNLPNVQFIATDNALNFAKNIVEQYTNKPFWRYFLLAALLFLLAEILVLRFLK